MVTIVADAAVVEIMEDAAMDAIAGAGITGDVAVPADGTGITGKYSAMDSAKAMMPGSVMDSGKAGTMTADRADLVDLEVRGGQGMAVIPGADAAEQELPYFLSENKEFRVC